MVTTENQSSTAQSVKHTPTGKAPTRVGRSNVQELLFTLEPCLPTHALPLKPNSTPIQCSPIRRLEVRINPRRPSNIS